MQIDGQSPKRNVNLLPVIKDRKAPIGIRKSNQRHIVKLNQDIELVKSLSFDRRVNEINEHMRTMKQTIESIDNNEEVLTKRRGRNSKDQSSTLPNSPTKAESTFSIKQDNLQHRVKMESEKLLEQHLINKTTQLSALNNDLEALNHKIAYYQDEITSLSFEIDLIFNHQKYTVNSQSESLDASPRKKDKPLSFLKKNVLAQAYYVKTEKKERLEKEKLELIDKLKAERDKHAQHKQSISAVKREIKELKNKMRDYYQVLLYKGTEHRQEGLIGYIKAIWNLGFAVDLKFLPSFLDKECIDYLFITAKKSLEISALRQKIKETKLRHSSELRNHLDDFKFETGMKYENKPRSPVSNLISQYAEKEQCKEKKVTLRQINAKLTNKRPLDNGILIVFSAMNKLSFRLNQLEFDMIKLREKEVKRITMEYIVNDYENKYGVAIETLISALVGEAYKDKELSHSTHLKNVSESSDITLPIGLPGQYQKGCALLIELTLSIYHFKHIELN